jgi:hypothetical protein
MPFNDAAYCSHSLSENLDFDSLSLVVFAPLRSFGAVLAVRGAGESATARLSLSLEYECEDEEGALHWRVFFLTL